MRARENETAVGPEIGIDKILRKTGSLRLTADENGDAKNDAAHAQDESAFAMREEAQRDVERRRHRGT